MIKSRLGQARRMMRATLIRADSRIHNLFGLTVSPHHREFPVIRPIAADRVEILADASFSQSCREIEGLTLLDTPRLANLWDLCRMSNPTGNIIEVGSFRGGGALHLSNSCPTRRIIACDSFAGFSELDPVLDSSFGHHMFTDTNRGAVEQLFIDRGRDALVLAGFFPQSASGVDMGPLSFAHIDVDVYKATIESLEYLGPRMLEYSLILLDDYNRKADGVNMAVKEFVRAHRDWVAFPLFPSQAFLVHQSWLDGRS